MKQFIEKLSHRDAITNANTNPRTSIHITKAADRVLDRMQNKLLKEGIKATKGQICYAAVSTVDLPNVNQDLINKSLENDKLKQQINVAINKITTLNQTVISLQKQLMK